MTNFRESLPSTLESGLQEAAGDDIRPVDKLRAFSYSPKTGTLLWRLIYDLDSSVYAELVSAVVAELEIERKLVELALHEYLSPQCRRCKGMKTLKIEDKTVDCPACKDKPGKHRYSDRERAAYLRCSVGEIRRKSKKIGRIHECLSAYDRAVNVGMNARLES